MPMQTPDFFAAVPTLRLRDPLADFLGACAHGEIEYSYLDVVKLAGHSCPTVAAAYGLTRHALRALYGNELPLRGGIHVALDKDAQEGVTGVIANVISMLTGATLDTGFKGIAGQFDRRRLLAFNADIPLEIRYTRTDTGAAVDAAAHLRQVAADPDMPALMQQCLRGQAPANIQQRFGLLWQARVERILLDHGDDPAVFEIRPVVTA
jgi:hypothetical protein